MYHNKIPRDYDKLEAIAKPQMSLPCHSERREERIFEALTSFTAFRMTEKEVLH